MSWAEKSVREQDRILRGGDEGAWQLANEIEQNDAHARMVARMEDGRAPVCVALGSIVAAGFLLRAATNPEMRDETIRLAVGVLTDAITDGPAE